MCTNRTNRKSGFTSLSRDDRRRCSHLCSTPPSGGVTTPFPVRPSNPRQLRTNTHFSFDREWGSTDRERGAATAISPTSIRPSCPQSMGTPSAYENMNPGLPWCMSVVAGEQLFALIASRSELRSSKGAMCTKATWSDWRHRYKGRNMRLRREAIEKNAQAAFQKGAQHHALPNTEKLKNVNSCPSSPRLVNHCQHWSKVPLQSTCANHASPASKAPSRLRSTTLTGHGFRTPRATSGVQENPQRSAAAALGQSYRRTCPNLRLPIPNPRCGLSVWATAEIG